MGIFLKRLHLVVNLNQIQMKKLLLFATHILIFIGFSSAQITITTTDMPVVNDTIRYSTTLNIQGQDPTQTGANHTWDYSALTSNTQRLDTFFAVTSTPTAYQFFFNNSILYASHKANYALRGQDITFPPIVPIPISFTEVFNFVKNSASKYENVGFGSKISGFPNSTRKQPIDVEYVFPLNDGDTSYSASQFNINIPTLAYYGQTMERENKVDGWGSLTIPMGTYNVLRVKSILTKVDTIFLDTLGFGVTFPRPEETEYKWLANGMSTPILKIVTSLGVVTNIEYQDTIPVVGIQEESLINSVSVFPNPTKEFVQVIFNSKNAGNLAYSIKDVNGKLILSNNFNANTGKNVFVIDLRNNQLTKGIYFVELLMNSQLVTQKLVVTE
jgi:hypothetical protein